MSRPMRVLAVVRPDAKTRPGGDLIHAERTAAALRDLGLEVDVVDTLEPEARGYDVAHVFGIFEPETARRQFDAIHRLGTPLALSPIWLDLRGLFSIGPQVERALSARDVPAVERRFARLRRVERRFPWRDAGARAADRRLQAQRELAREADVLLPASETEAYLYAERLDAGDVPFVVAPLGIDESAFDVERAGLRRGILCAGRIEAKKNQAALLYAVRDLDVDVTLAGEAHDASYLALCRRWATPRTRFAGHLAHAEVLALMARCAVHAHPSWLETPGLSSLEAAAAGAQVVVGERGCEREYFGAGAHYADPADPSRIRAAIETALRSAFRARDDVLERRLRTFTWRRHAEATRQAYELAAAGRR